MMSVAAAENVEFIRSYFAEMLATSGRGDAVDKFVSDEKLKQHIRWAQSVAPGYEVVPEQMVAEGDTVAVRGKVKGVQLGEFNGIPPTGRAFSVDVAIFYRVKDRKIVDHWMLFDALDAMKQLQAA